MSSYRQIFKSTALIGGTQVINILIGVIRTKVLAVLLGPSGIGLAGMYQAATGLLGTLTGFGIGSAGVRQIAEAAGSEDKLTIARTVKTLRLTSLISGLLGMALVLILCVPLTRATFGNKTYIFGVALMSLTLLFNGVSTGQTALLQGMRLLKDLATCEVLGAVFGAIAGIAIIYFFGAHGVAPYLVTVSAFTILTSWWYARKVKVEAVRMSLREMSAEVRGLLGMGAAFLTSGLLGAGVAYVIRVLIIRDLGMGAVGLYAATWTLSSVYIGIILKAMGADFYPRLTAIAADNKMVNRLVNEQTEMGVLMAIPGILGTLTLAPWVLRFFYSAAFTPATVIIRWQLLGVALRVASWPMGYVQIAKGMPKLFMITESVFAVFHIGILFFCLRFWRLEGIGFSCLVVDFFYTLVMFGVCRRITCFSWSRKSLLAIAGSIVAAISVLLTVSFLPLLQATIIGLAITSAVSFISLMSLQKLLGIDILRLVRSKLDRVSS